MFNELTTIEQKSIIYHRSKMFNAAINTKNNNINAIKTIKKLFNNYNNECFIMPNPATTHSLYCCTSDDVRPESKYIFKYNFRYYLQVELKKSIDKKLYKILEYEIVYHLHTALNNAMHGSTKFHFNKYLMYSMFNCLCDTGWIALFSFASKYLNIEFTSGYQRILECYENLTNECFAVYMKKNSYYIVENPCNITLNEDGLYDMDFNFK